MHDHAKMDFIYDPIRLQTLNHRVKINSTSRRPRWPSWNNLKKRLNLKRINLMNCCGSSSWVLDTNLGEEPLIITGDQSPTTLIPEPCIRPIPAENTTTTTTMNLATALAADRNVGPLDVNKGRPLKSIIRLFEDVKVVELEDENQGGIGTMCCLCTERNKGAALIPCGHTYCRVCSRAMWLKQGSCPLCNRLIMDILEIF